MQIANIFPDGAEHGHSREILNLMNIESSIGTSSEQFVVLLGGKHYRPVQITELLVKSGLFNVKYQ